MTPQAASRPRRPTSALAAVLLVCVIGVRSAAAAPAQGTITVTLTDFESNKGMAMLALYDNAQAFPTKPEQASQRLRLRIENKRVVATFPGVRQGTYAISAFHDENGNGVLDSNFLGIPKEPLGCSNNAKGRMGPPKWDDAKFILSGPTAAQTIAIRRI